jgi:hypothetical protein
MGDLTALASRRWQSIEPDVALRFHLMQSRAVQSFWEY